jgi:hypothetical protein
MKTFLAYFFMVVFSLKLQAQIPDPCTGAGAAQAISTLSPCNCTEAQGGTPCNKTSFATKPLSDAAINLFLTTQSTYALPTTPTNWQDVRGSAMSLSGTFKHEFCTEVTTSASTNKLNILNIAQVQVNCNAVCQDYKIIKKSDVCGLNQITPTLVASALDPTVFYRQYIVSPSTTYIICRQLYFSGDLDCLNTWTGGDGISSLGAQVTAQHWFYYEEAIVTPLYITTFNGIKINDKNVLQWNVVNQNNIANFTIEKSMDGNSFYAIGNVIADNTTSQKPYTFTDATSIESNTYYRIKVTEKNNASSYSTTIKITAKNTNHFISITPNPAKDFAQLNVYAKKTSKALIYIVDASGAIVLTQNANLYNGINNIVLDVTRLYKGIYFVKITNEQEVFNQKLIIQ